MKYYAKSKRYWEGGLRDTTDFRRSYVRTGRSRSVSKKPLIGHRFYEHERRY